MANPVDILKAFHMNTLIKHTLALTVMGLTAVAAHAGPQCTTEPQSKWMPAEVMKKKIADEGYQIEVFKVTKGNCYEIYGRDKKGQRAEVYYHPVTGAVVKSRS